MSVGKFISFSSLLCWLEKERKGYVDNFYDHIWYQWAFAFVDFLPECVSVWLCHGLIYCIFIPFFQVPRMDIGPLITLWIGFRLLPLTRGGPVISLVLPVIWLLSWILPESMFYSDVFGNVMTCAVISDVSMTVYLSLYFLTATFLWFVLQFRFSSFVVVFCCCFFGVFLVYVCMFVFVFLFVVLWRGGSFCLFVVVVVLGVVVICFWGGRTEPVVGEGFMKHLGL